MIKVENLVKKFDQSLALNDVSFEIGKGEIVGLLGPNGAGKTTTLRIIAGYLPPTSGKVSIKGIDIMENPQDAKKHIGYMPENVPLYLDMEVREYLEFFAKLLGAPKDKMQRHLDGILEKTGLTKRQKDLIGTLSKGYRQRVGLAQALLGGPDVLILDEPTIGLDPIQIIEIRNLIKDLAREQTVILSSHILPEVQATCNRIMIINGGKIVADGKPDELSHILKGAKVILAKIRGSKDDIIKKFKNFANVGKIDMLEPIKTDLNIYRIETDAHDAEEKIAKITVDGGWGLQELKPEHLELEEIFLKLTTKEKRK